MHRDLSLEIAQLAAAPKLRPATGPVAPLHPHRLDDDVLAAIAHFQNTGESENTRRGYRQALRYWLAWFELRYGRPLQLPVHPAGVLQFVVDHLEKAPGARDQQLPAAVDARLVAAGVKANPGPVSLNTVQLRLSALARAHRDRNLPSPTEANNVRRLLRTVRAAYSKAGVVENKKAALDAGRMQMLLATCDESPIGVRDRALLAFGFASGGRRRSEIADADFAHLVATTDGWRYRLAYSKTNKTGARRPEDFKPVVGEAAAALGAWLQMMDDQGIARESNIFRRVRRGGFIEGGLSTWAVRDIVQRRCAMAGLPVEDFSAHSLRSGFLTQAGRAGVPLKDAMAMSGHASVATALGYMRTEELANSAAARLLDDFTDKR